MNEEISSDLLQFSQVIGFARRRLLLIILGATVGAIFGFYSSGYIPKRYKAKAILTIQSGYFDHPLIRDVVAGIQDTAEMSSQRSGLIRLALDEEFLRSFGARFFAPTSSPSTALQAIDPELTLKRIEYFSTNPSSFQISVMAPSAQTAFSATNEVVNQIILTLEKHRHQRLFAARHALVEQATDLQQLISEGHSKLATESTDSQLTELHSRLGALKKHLSEVHPDVVALKRQISAASSKISASPAPSMPEANESSERVFLHPQFRNTAQEIVDTLLRKISDLTVVLHTRAQPGSCSFVDIIERPRLPTGSFYPNRPQFTLIGAAAGLFIALSIAVRAELQRLWKMTPDQAAKYLGIDLLAELPLLPPSPEASPKNCESKDQPAGFKTEST